MRETIPLYRGSNLSVLAVSCLFGCLGVVQNKPSLGNRSGRIMTEEMTVNWADNGSFSQLVSIFLVKNLFIDDVVLWLDVYAGEDWSGI